MNWVHLVAEELRIVQTMTGAVLFTQGATFAEAIHSRYHNPCRARINPSGRNRLQEGRIDRLRISFLLSVCVFGHDLSRNSLSCYSHISAVLVVVGLSPRTAAVQLFFLLSFLNVRFFYVLLRSVSASLSYF